MLGQLWVSVRCVFPCLVWDVDQWRWSVQKLMYCTGHYGGGHLTFYGSLTTEMCDHSYHSACIYTFTILSVFFNNGHWLSSPMATNKLWKIIYPSTTLSPFVCIKLPQLPLQGGVFFCVQFVRHRVWPSHPYRVTLIFTKPLLWCTRCSTYMYSTLVLIPRLYQFLKNIWENIRVIADIFFALSIILEW